MVPAFKPASIAPKIDSQAQSRADSFHDPVAPIPPEPTFDGDETAVRETAAKPVGKVIVPSDFSRAHPLVRLLLNEDEKREAEQKARTYYSSWNSPRFVSRFDRRRLKIANGLLLSAAKCGAKWSISSKDDLAFVATIGSRQVALKVAKAVQILRRQVRGKEVVDDIDGIEVVLGATEYPSSKRSISWKDADDVKVESFSTEIVRELFIEAELGYRDQAIHHHQWLIKRQADEIEARRKRKEEAEKLERERQEKLEGERVDRLIEDAEALRRAGEIREYVAKTLAAQQSRLDAVDGIQLERWRKWALAQADRIDPVINGSFLALSAELLGDAAPSGGSKN